MILLYLLILFSFTFSLTLQEAYDNASGYEEYEKYIVLEPNSIYTGGIGIYEGDIYINCQGSVIDLEQGNGIWVYADVIYPSSLHIEYCTITNGQYYGLSFGGLAEGNIINCNLVNTNFGMKLFDESDVYVTNCIFSDHLTYGIGLYSESPTLNTSYSLFWNNNDADCMENCPGWGNIWTQLELSPGIGVLYEDPQFIDSEHLNFELSENSPCINSGNPDFYSDVDGSISDIGSNPYIQNINCNIYGDLNLDNNIDILDIVLLSGCILYSENCTICFDVNEDDLFNILDILHIVNVIINN